MTPLSMEKESLGRPEMFHARILIGSPRVLLREKLLDDGMFIDWSDGDDRLKSDDERFQGW